MDQQALKKAVAEAALAYITPGMILGVGSGSTVDCFIAALTRVKGKIEGVVVASNKSAAQIKALSLPILDLNSVSAVDIYIDGADEINDAKQMIKGGGGALTREKIIANVATTFVCIIDQSKKVDVLGQFPVAVEVIPMARSFVARQIVKLGGDPVYREGFKTDNGNVILDIYNFKILEPKVLEESLNNIAGVVSNGIFAQRTADVVLISGNEGVTQF